MYEIQKREEIIKERKPGRERWKGEEGRRKGARKEGKMEGRERRGKKRWRERGTTLSAFVFPNEKQHSTVKEFGS